MRETAPLLIRFGSFELDEANARLKRHDLAVDLPPRAFSVLCELARRPSQLVTKEALLDAVWGHRHVSESVLKSAVKQLRATFDDDPKTPRFIETAARRGYRFIAAVGSGAGALPSAGPPAGSTTPGEGAPAVVSVHYPGGMTGRRGALAQLHAAWQQACAGQRQVCWVAGDAGVGKTTLVDHFAASLGPVTIAHGQCVEQHGPGEPYLPVLEALAALCRHDSALVQLLHGVAPTWLLQLPWLCNETERDGLRRELTGTSQARMLREFGELLDRYTQDQPLLLVTEDLHWSDQSTVVLLDHVARRRGRARWLWLATFRAAALIADDHPLKAVRHELRMHRLCEEILLDPFSERELADYVAMRLGNGRGSEAFVRALHQHTDGLPLFVANVVDELQREGTPSASADWHAASVAFQALALPESLAGVMERQIQRLSADQVALLEVASACGVAFSPIVVSQVLERDPDWVAMQCDMLAGREQWLTALTAEQGAGPDGPGHFAFRHALWRHVFHRRMGTMARAQAHRRVAMVLASAEAAERNVSAAAIATQFELAHDPAAALPYSAAAATSALEQFAPADAMRLAEGGLDLARRCSASRQVTELTATLHTLRGAAASQVLGVSADETLQAFELARAAMVDCPQHPFRGMALHGLGLGLFLRGELTPARELAERELSVASRCNDPVLVVTACDLLGQILKLEGPAAEAVSVLEHGIEVAMQLDEQTLRSAFVLDPLVNMQAALGISWLLAGHERRAKVQSDLALARARALKQPMARMIATWLAMLCELRRGSRDQVALLAAQLRAITEEGALAQAEGPSRWFEGLVNAWSGAPVEGHALIDAAYQRYAQVGMLYGASEVQGYAAEALLLAGDRVHALQRVDEALGLSTRLHDHSYRTQLLLLQRRIAMEQGAHGDAAAAGQQALLEARRQRSPWLELTVLVALCEEPPTGGAPIGTLRDAVAHMPEASDAPVMKRALALLSLG